MNQVQNPLMYVLSLVPDCEEKWNPPVDSPVSCPVSMGKCHTRQEPQGDRLTESQRINNCGFGAKALAANLVFIFLSIKVLLL